MLHREAGGMFGIAIEELASERVDVLTQTGHDESPSVAPNGMMVLYDTVSAGKNVLAQVSTNGLIRLNLPSPDGNVQDPAWGVA